MLHITPEAGLAIQKLTNTEGVTATGGLRIVARALSDKLALSVAALPMDNDLVVTEETTGTRVLLDTMTADYVDDKTLDVTDTVESKARFALTPQGLTKSD